MPKISQKLENIGIEKHRAVLPAAAFAGALPAGALPEGSVQVDLYDVGGREGLRPLPGPLANEVRGRREMKK